MKVRVVRRSDGAQHCQDWDGVVANATQSTAVCVLEEYVVLTGHYTNASQLAAVKHAGALEVDEAAGFAAAFALELRDSGAAKGARARKKAALHDLQEGLAALGASHLRSAVPAHDRAVQAWFRRVWFSAPLSILLLGVPNICQEISGSGAGTPIECDADRILAFNSLTS